MNPLRIGVPQSGYNVDRNIPQVQGVHRVRPWDYHRARTAWSFKLHGRLDKYHQFSFTGPHFPQADFFHFFNSVSTSSTPWFTTYEDIIPRWWSQRSASDMERGIQSIVSDACKGIIGFSHATEHVLKQCFLEQGFADKWEQIAPKRHVLLPPQQLLPPLERESDMVRFCFVGGDFYRKGGAEVIAAYHLLHARGIKNWQLTIVGNLSSWGDYASKTGPEDEGRTRALISEMGGLVTHHEKLPNEQVMSLLASSHYLLFPTFQDTFGYVVLEAMASGCVPVVSKTRVFPEIIQNGENGFLIDLPTDASGDAHRTATTPEEKQKLTQRLETTIKELIEIAPDDWLRLSSSCRAHIQEHHNPERHRESLLAIYQSGL